MSDNENDPTFIHYSNGEKIWKSKDENGNLVVTKIIDDQGIEYQYDTDGKLIFKSPVPTVWSGRTTAYCHKSDDWQTRDMSQTKKALRKVWLLDVQWSTCPIEVKDEVKTLWSSYELGNDYSIVKTDLDTLIESGHLLIRQYLLECEPDLKDDEQVIIHWWW